ncbi:cytosolic Fe-S cluster assembly factor NUBP2 homolog, partial [Sabethes cyaneus]|uniref:cytosolic Fe-S cluster assembly factor NUBP2 homolog n=1 Tax=Sabethes cyaneus TaxID=53552 RepID=UPI00237EA6F8
VQNCYHFPTTEKSGISGFRKQVVRITSNKPASNKIRLQRESKQNTQKRQTRVEVRHRAKIALTLSESGYKVGLLDIDLCGLSVPFLLGLEDHDVHQCEEGWVPVYTSAEKKLAVMSIGFLLKSRTEAVIWRGPKKTAMIKQFLEDVAWDELDYLIIDTPPGTSDEHITAMESLKGVNADCDNASGNGLGRRPKGGSFL